MGTIWPTVRFADKSYLVLGSLLFALDRKQVRDGPENTTADSSASGRVESLYKSDARQTHWVHSRFRQLVPIVGYNFNLFMTYFASHGCRSRLEADNVLPNHVPKRFHL